MRYIIGILAVFIFLAGCSSKSKFAPEEIASTLKYDANMKSELYNVSRDGATYANGMVVTKARGLLEDKIAKGFRFVFDSGSSLLTSKEDGTVQVLKDGNAIFEHKFEFAIASGAVKDNMLALVFSNNTLMLYDMQADKEYYSESLEPTFANDGRLANPLFLNDLVVFPTLDGRLLIMDAQRKVIVRDVSISNKALFNNVIFLEERNNILVAATGSKIISINPRNINTKRIDVKDLIYTDKAIYLFTKTGKIVLMDLNLRVVKEKKFPFAMFSAIMSSDKLYAVEKSGYLIEIDGNLETSKVYELPSEINKPLFSFKDRLFFGQHFLKLK